MGGSSRLRRLARKDAFARGIRHGVGTQAPSVLPAGQCRARSRGAGAALSPPGPSEAPSHPQPSLSASLPLSDLGDFREEAAAAAPEISPARPEVSPAEAAAGPLLSRAVLSIFLRNTAAPGTVREHAGAEPSRAEPCHRPRQPLA
ncbi:bone morphogenetic protein 1 [Grus japonensis]|uniref:Bone morphogenetic protein 1 n=1 Tax=Grus japonensis TaxID=30415 RepID=A0ABC9XS44_GRUJA